MDENLINNKKSFEIITQFTKNIENNYALLNK